VIFSDVALTALADGVPRLTAVPPMMISLAYDTLKADAVNSPGAVTVNVAADGLVAVAVIGTVT
jgi:hypothetical protein